MGSGLRNLFVRRTFSLVLAFGIVGLCATAGLAECPAKPYATLPLTLNAAHEYAVSVQINGHPFILAIDTAAPKTILAEHTVTAAGMSRKSFGAHVSMASGAKGSAVATGEFIIAGFRIDAMDFPVVPDRGLNANEDGLLGANILSHFDVEFDFAHSTMSLYPQSRCASVPWAHTGAINTVELYFETDHVVFPVDLDGKVYNAHLDTGASRAYIDLETAKSFFGFDESNPGQLERRGVSSRPIYFHVFDTLKAGNLTINKPELMLVSNANATVRMKQPWMSFGLTLLKNYHLFIAYDEKRLYFTDTDANPNK